MISSKLDPGVPAGGGKGALNQMANNNMSDGDVISSASIKQTATTDTTNVISTDELSNVLQLEPDHQHKQKHNLTGINANEQQLSTTTVLKMQKLSRPSTPTTPNKSGSIDSTQGASRESNDNEIIDNNECGVDTSKSDEQLKGSNLPTSTTLIKKKRKIEETIIDGFAISAFRTWEDLQDELNERIATQQISNSNVTAEKSASKKTASPRKPKIKQQLISTTSSSTSADNNANSQSQNSNSSARKSKRKDKNKKEKCNPKMSNDSPSGSSTNSTESKQQQPLTTSNKPNNIEKSNLKKALEAKELAEKRLSLLQQKLEQGDDGSREQNNKSSSNGTTNGDSGRFGSTSHEHLSRHQQQQHIQRNKNDHPSEVSDQNQHRRPNNGTLAQDLLKDPTLPSHAQPKYPAYPPFGMNAHYMMSSGHHPSHMMHHPSQQAEHQYQNGLPSRPPHQGSSSHSQQPSFDTKPPLDGQRFLHGLPNQQQRHHQSPAPQRAPSAQAQAQAQYQHNQNRPINSFNPNFFTHQAHTPSYHGHHHHQIPSQYPATSISSHMSSHQQHSQLHTQHQQPGGPPSFGYPTHPAQANPMVASMGMTPMASPYSPYIITDTTISRQTSIIPTAMDHVASAAAAASRYGHHASMLQSMNHYNSPAASAAAAVASASQTHHTSSMYYPPPLPTERSFMEFARSYTGGPAYPSLMHSFPSHASPQSSTTGGSAIVPSVTANPYAFDRWPRSAAFDHHQRAASRYSSLYQTGTAALPDRTNYANFPTAATVRPPTFPAGLFPPPF